MASTFNDASQDAKEQIAQLREQVQSLMSERVSPALSSAADTAQKYAGQAREGWIPHRPHRPLSRCARSN